MLSVVKLPREFYATKSKFSKTNDDVLKCNLTLIFVPSGAYSNL